MKYAEVVRDLDANFSLSTAWRSHYTIFRLQKTADPTIPWDYFNMELWVWALSTSVGFTPYHFVSRSPSPFQFASQSGMTFLACVPLGNPDSGSSVWTTPRAIAGPITDRVSVIAEAADSYINAPLAPVVITVCPVNDSSFPTLAKKTRFTNTWMDIFQPGGIMPLT